MNQIKHVPFDILGNIAIVKFKKEASVGEKRKFATRLLRSQKSVKTVLEKVGKFKGMLRKQATKYVAGEKTKEALYRENGCVFRFNVDKTYFSPRLSNERKEIAKKVKKGDAVLVMFAGVAPYSVVIAKNSKASRVFSNEINREANKYAELNIGLNKVKDKVILLPGNIKKVVKLISKTPKTRRQSSRTQTPKSFNDGNLSLKNIPAKFDVIVMPRPQLKDTFLREAFSLSKKGTRIFYYDFCKEDEIPSIVEKIKPEAKKSKKKVKILGIKRAGEIAPYKFRIRIDFVVL